MNFVFWLLIIVVLVMLWFCLSFAFKGVGSFGLKLFNDAKDAIEEVDPKESQKEEEGVSKDEER